MNSTSPIRITMMMKNPNPLFEKWLLEYINDLEENTKESEMFNYALTNLRKYTLPLKSLRECRILKGFDEKVYKMLKDKEKLYQLSKSMECNVSDHNYRVPDSKPISYTSNQTNHNIICIDSDSNDENKDRFAPTEEMLHTDTNIIEDNVPLSSSSQMSTRSHDFLNKTKAIKRHASCSSTSSRTKTLKTFSSISSECSQTSLQEDYFIIGPGNFDVILYVDTCETIGSNANIKDDRLLSELQKLGIYYEVKDLKVGDYAWICRDKILKKELVLPYIVERKRMDDLAKSIKDGRYHEQKYRLKRSGIQHITYLIEECSANKFRFPKSTLDQATDNTAIRDGFYVKVTKNIKHTARYLADTTKLLNDEYKSKTVASCQKENLIEISDGDDLVSLMTFKEFNQGSIKNKPSKISDRFVRMLLQINGMTVDKALGIVAKYPTPFLLQKAYENECFKGENLLASIPGKFSNTAVGSSLSKIVYDVFK